MGGHCLVGYQAEALGGPMGIGGNAAGLVCISHSISSHLDFGLRKSHATSTSLLAGPRGGYRAPYSVRMASYLAAVSALYESVRTGTRGPS